jgi:hypothetical protein
MKIDELLDKYFEGETSCEEERELRRFFTEEEVPEHLQTYRPLFAYLNREATSMAEPTEEKSVTTESAKEVFPSLSHILCCQRHCRRIAPASRGS